MKKNMATADRIIRLIISVLFITLYFSGVIDGALGITLITVSVIFTLTSLISFCPIYKLIGLKKWEK
ncbi:MAG: DUF2892 domain-containing protein [Bacteroidetes bacterium]|nr:DUF2892 domain-containing protein [Bacteroidota bacterium]